jgi:hypothetical protein
MTPLPAETVKGLEVARRVVLAIRAAGYTMAVRDAESCLLKAGRTNTADKIMRAVASVDETWLVLFHRDKGAPRGLRCGSVLLIPENGDDCVADWCAPYDVTKALETICA